MTSVDRTGTPDEEVRLPDHLDRVHRTAREARDLLARAAVPRWELFAKASSTRELVWRPGTPLEVVQTEETGVGVRTTRGTATGFGAASGAEASAARRAAEGALSAEVKVPFDPIPPSRLLGTTPVDVARDLPSAGWAAHVAHELSEAVAGIEVGLRVVRLAVEEGSYAWVLATGEGFVASHGGTAVALVAEVATTGPTPHSWRDWLHVPDPAAFDCVSVAERIADRAALTVHGGSGSSGVRDVLLHPEVTANLIAALVPAFVSTPREGEPLARVLDRDGRLAGEALSLVDDRTDMTGPIAGPCDGEGLPARRNLLLEHGVPRHFLGSYHDAVASGDLPRGGAIRVSYRDYPTGGTSNLRVVTDEGLPPSALLARADRALYLTRPVAPVEADIAHDSIRMLASGVWLDRGRIAGGHPVVELRGGLGRMLRRVDAVGTDSRWFQTAAGFIAAPSLLIRAQKVIA